MRNGFASRPAVAPAHQDAQPGLFADEPRAPAPVPGAAVAPPSAPAAVPGDGEALAAGSAQPRAAATGALSLSALLRMVECAVRNGLPDAYWVQAEIVDFKKTQAGHVYLDLIEREQNATKPKAQTRAIVWADAAAHLTGRFRAETGTDLRGGIAVLVHAKVTFSPLYGCSLTIVDIDPAYTAGAMAAHVARIRLQLAEQGISERNRQLAVPVDLFHVAVIAPEAAAGLGDFRREADVLQRHGVTQFSYFHAMFQGERAAATLCAAIAAAAACKPDLIVILRGGGGTADLQYLNDFALARAICMAPVPVVVGIGHEKDKTILDEVAAVSLGTPSKVAGFIASVLKARAAGGREAMAMIQALAQAAVAKRREAVVRHIGTIQAGAATIALRHRQKAAEHLRGTVQMAQVHASQRRQHAMRAIEGVRRDALRHLAERRASATMLFREIAGQGPERTLARGFALARGPNGKVVSSADAAVAAERLQLQFVNGTINVKVSP